MPISRMSLLSDKRSCVSKGARHGQGSSYRFREGHQGKVKEAVGKAIGDVKLESEGKADKVEGEVQNAVGSLKDMLRGE